MWNLARLAECLLPLLGDNEDAAKDALAGFAPRFQAAYFSGLRRKIGLTTEREGDDGLAQDLLKLMAADGADFTLTFRRLCDGAAAAAASFKDAAAFAAWSDRWTARLDGERDAAATMRAANPAFIPRNHLVEAAITAAAERSDYQPFERLLAVVIRPFEDDPALALYATPPTEDERVLQTFCGT